MIAMHFTHNFFLSKFEGPLKCRRRHIDKIVDTFIISPRYISLFGCIWHSPFDDQVRLNLVTTKRTVRII